MQILKRGFLLILIVNVLYPLSSQNNINKNLFYEAFIEGDIIKWDKNLSDVFNKDGNNQLLSDKLEYTFGITGWYLRDQITDKARQWNNRLNLILNSEQAKSLNASDLDVYKNAYLCYYISIEKKQQIRYGRECFANAKKIVENNPNNIMARILLGNIYMNMPYIFGGSNGKAADNFKAVVDIIENKKMDNKNWVYIYSLLKLAEIYYQESSFNLYEYYIDKIKTKEHSINPDVIKSITIR